MGIDAHRALDLSSVVSRQNTANQSAQHDPQSTHNVGGPSEVMLPGLVLQVDDETFGTVLDVSHTVPVAVCFVRDIDNDEGFVRLLADAVIKEQGRVVLVTVDTSSSPQLTESFQVSEFASAQGGASPVVGAVIAGKPMQLFAGAQPASTVNQILRQLIAVAEQNGVKGTVITREDMPSSTPPLAPLHQEAFDAIERGDYDAAREAYEKAMRENPRDDMARAGLAQVSLVRRLQGKTLSHVRNAVAANPHDIDAQLDVADLDLSGGHVDDAFGRLLQLFSEVEKDQREPIRVRLLELFEVVGTSDPRVVSARARLTALLF